MKFSDVPIGAKFRFCGRTFRKVADSMAQDDRRWGAAFIEDSEVELLDSEGAQEPAPQPWSRVVRPAKCAARPRRRWGSLTFHMGHVPEDSGK